MTATMITKRGFAQIYGGGLTFISLYKAASIRIGSVRKVTPIIRTCHHSNMARATILNPSRNRIWTKEQGVWIKHVGVAIAEG